MPYVKKGYPHGEQHRDNRLTQEQVLEIFFSREKELWLAATYCVCRSTIGDIRRKHTWTWLTAALDRHADTPLSIHYRSITRTHK